MKIICPICHQSFLRKLKKIKGIQIFECAQCSLSIIPRNLVSKRDACYSLKKYQKEKRRLQQRFQRLALKIYSFVRKGKILDIGSGFGLLSSILNKLGNYNFYLIDNEIEPYYFQNAKNLKFKKIDFSDFIKKNNDKYELVLMFDIIEHFKNPQAVLRKIRHILKNNSYLIIQTPNYQSLMAKICRHWSWWMIEDHKVVFSPKSIKKIFSIFGYEIICLETYEDWYDLKKNLDGNFVKIKSLFIRRVMKLFFYIPFFSIYFILRKVFWFFGWGGLIFLIAKKKYNTNDEKQNFLSNDY